MRPEGRRETWSCRSESCRWVPSPRGVTSRNLVPSTVSVLIAASVRSPSSTRTVDCELHQHLVPSRRMLETLPTDIPDTRTSLSGLMPPASAK